MRRGHLSSGGWRTENPRQHRPRNPGNPRFRPPRPYNLHNPNRFPHPGPRLHRPPHFGNYPNRGDQHYDDYTDHYERHTYRNHNSPQRNSSLNSRHRGHYQNRGGGQRQILPYLQQTRTLETQISNIKCYDNNKSQAYHINSMGDVDHRIVANNSLAQERLLNHSPWVNPHFDCKSYQNKSPQKHHLKYNENIENKNSQPNYPGHRPPASDHYSTTPDLENTNNDISFSRSIDDTVDIVRKRLLNRNEPPSPSCDDPNENQMTTINTSSIPYENPQQEQPVKRRVQRQRQIEKSNCDKMKNNIVKQLFKMDKDKIHKLMDNPNSSTKFEYAINSFITESQNSLNRHMRSLAEKSLSSSSHDFIHNDNNTIYEDTFMKQMQCILDPQDTVLLEDIKPLVLAELSKILKLNNVQQVYEIAETEDNTYSAEHVDYDYHSENIYNDNYAQERYLNQDEIDDYTDFHGGEVPKFDEQDEMKHPIQSHPNNLYRRRSSESFKSTENKRNNTNQQVIPEIKPLFETHREQSSEDEDPFAELDRQYHVPVDHTFLESEDCINPSTSTSKSANEFVSPKTEKPSLDDIPNHSEQIKNEIQIKNNSDLCIKLENTLPEQDSNVISEIITNDLTCSVESPVQNASMQSYSETMKKHFTSTEIKEEINPVPKYVEKKISEKDLITNKGIVPTSSRKRSIDQRPYHRKEKRKKSDPGLYDSNKHNSNKNTNKNVNSGTSKNVENSEDVPKPLFNLFLSKNENNKHPSKDAKRLETGDKGYSDKYVKRKEYTKKHRHTTPMKKHNNTNYSHSIISKDDNTSPVDISTSSNNQSSNRIDTKTKLKTIDMFMDQPKKSNLHQAHRNTSIAPSKNGNPIGKHSPNKQTGVSHKENSIKKLISKETQTINKSTFNTKSSQTERKKFNTKSIQTDPISVQKETTKSTDVFERMKEIDLEIQVLLQEKFKLYNSFESNNTCPVNEQTLGMTVLNVVPVNRGDGTESAEIIIEGDLSEDSIVDDFSNIPVEELEQIALETVEETEPTQERRLRRHSQKQVEQNVSALSPSSLKRSNRKGKPLNISLLEQIITDDRPLEDIIVLDELENVPSKVNKKKSQRTHTPKARKVSKKMKPSSTSINLSQHNIKECSVVLQPLDISPYLELLCEEPSECDEAIAGHKSPIYLFSNDTLELPSETLNQQMEVIEETDVNDIQFDMLDVSEDIVIGDNCEIKSRDTDRIDVPISEDIILDNSQSSCDNAISEFAQNEPECKTYDYSTDENLRRDAITVTGNADAVLAIECIENNFIAACLDGNVYHFNSDGQLLNTLRGSNLAVTCITIVKEKYGTTVYTGSLDSRIRYYDLETGVEKGPECNVLSPIQTMDRAWDTIFVGTRTGFVLQFECKNNMLIPVSTVKFSDQSILALRAMKEGPRKVLLVAARSENVTIKDAQTGLLLRSLVGPKMTVYTLLFEDGKVYCGTSSHQIHVFDYSTGSHVGSHEGGKGAVCLRATGGLVFAGCYDGCVYVYREGETRPLAQLRGPSLMLLSLAIVGSKIIAGYKDRGLYIWKIPLNILKEMIL